MDILSRTRKVLISAILLFVISITIQGQVNIKKQHQDMMFGDTSRTGSPFSKDPHVIKFSGRYLMYYSIKPYENKTNPVKGFGIGIAESSDLINWKRMSDNPFLSNGEPGEWNSSESGHPHIFKDDDGRTYLFFQGNNDNGKTWFLSQKEVFWNRKGPRF